MSYSRSIANRSTSARLAKTQHRRHSISVSPISSSSVRYGAGVCKEFLATRLVWFEKLTCCRILKVTPKAKKCLWIFLPQPQNSQMEYLIIAPLVSLGLHRFSTEPQISIAPNLNAPVKGSLDERHYVFNTDNEAHAVNVGGSKVQSSAKSSSRALCV